MRDKKELSGATCQVCGSSEGVTFIKITDCNLCEKCNNELAQAFELVMTSEYHENCELC